MEEVDILEAEEFSSSSLEDGEAFVKDALKKPDRMSQVVHDKALLKRQFNSSKRKRNSNRLREQEALWFKGLMQKREHNTTKGSCSKIDSDYFDPVSYLSNHPLICRKFHYSVPVTYEDSYTLLKFEPETNMLKFYPLARQQAIVDQGRMKTLLATPS